jgi:hypothetical protein
MNYVTLLSIWEKGLHVKSFELVARRIFEGRAEPTDKER